LVLLVSIGFWKKINFLIEKEYEKEFPKGNSLFVLFLQILFYNISNFEAISFL